MFFKIFAVAVLSAVVTMPALAQDAKRAITNIKGDVWRFQNNFHFSIFVITSEGAIVTDPIDTEAAAWLEAEIAKMTDRPVTHMIYSHSHGDHASGGKIFADTATVIAGAGGPADIDGIVPNTLLSAPLSITSGSHTIEVTPIGAGHGTDMLVTVVRPENVAFVVDVVSHERLPFKDFPRADIDGYINQIKVVETLDYDILAPGHGGLGDSADAAENRAYIEWLRDAVTADLKAGKSVEDIVASLDTSAYASWGSYDDWRDLNIQGMARWLTESGALN